MTCKCKIDKFGTKRWYNSKGQLHREDGPAVEYATGDTVWFVNGKQHRLDGPAMEYVNGSKTWYINGINYSHSDWLTKSRKLKLASL